MSKSPNGTHGSDVVLCYCDSDADYCGAFSQGLDSLRDEQVIARWHKQRVGAGDSAALPTGGDFQVMLVLLSPELLATGFLQQREFLSRVDGSDGIRSAVIPVLVRPVETTHRTLRDDVPPPIHAQPLCEVSDASALMKDIMGRIRDVSQSRSVSRPGLETMDRTMRLPDAETASNRPSSSSGPSPTRTAAAPSEVESDKPVPREAVPGAPERIGRYKIESVLGQGAFGAVYLARDEQLARTVAIKTPHRERATRPSDVESYMKEARMVAQLDHPGIVPVYDVGKSDEGQFFVVSKVIEGKDLSKRLRHSRPSLIESARLVALVAEALHYAHQRDLVHRDVKPANILVGDSDGRPYVADFGLAIHEDEIGSGPTRAGTPAYMSPEQARGEGHRVDGRSDVFSLGVVLYELITGRLPFRKTNIEELLQQISKSEARPPRQLEASIPRELERICLKAMSNKIKDRYTTAQDFADDLWYFIEQGPTQSSGFRSVAASGDGGTPRTGSGAAWESTASAPQASGAWTSSAAADRARRSSGTGDPTRSSRRGGGREGTPRDSSGRAGTGSGGGAGVRATQVGATSTATGSQVLAEPGSTKVVAKGLRAFDDRDADFFLSLVPGPRDRHGLPDVLRFWKTRLEDVTGEHSFPVGVVYGPSGCGKTSLVRAGLIPNLAPHVQVVFMDATTRDTETRLAQRIKNLCPDAAPESNLPDLVAWIRRGRGIPFDHKLVIVIDQFEQWLQTHENDRTGELLDALRQCDGTRVQCLLMIRVDFMMSIHRFMNDLEAPIQEGANSAPVDLFDSIHARKVLQLFGASYGRLPEEPAEPDAGQAAFLDAVVEELGPDGKIVPVQLALLAEMCKGRPWQLETLRQLGGARGIGAKFLEETFDSTTAPLEHRVYGKACRAVLKRLLPETESQIRGQSRTIADLAEAAHFSPQSKEFAALLTILDRNTRMITPVETDPTETPTGEAAATPEGVSGRYQLTHDYLVPALDEWLTKKQRETRRGRAELRLEEFSRLWNDRPAPQRLPGMVDWATIRWYTKPAQWTAPQRKMMGAAGRRVGMLTGATAAALVACALIGREVKKRFEAQRVANAVAQLATAETSSVPEIVAELKPLVGEAAPLLITAYADENASAKGKLNAALAAISLESAGASTDKMVNDVYAAIQSSSPDEIAAMVECLAPHADQIGDRADKDFANVGAQSASALPLASLMAAYRPKVAWDEKARDAVAAQFVAAPADSIGGWSDRLKPVKDQLVGPLQLVFADVEKPAYERDVAGDVLVAFAPEDEAERVKKLVDLVADSTKPAHFNRVIAELEPMSKAATQEMQARMAELAKQEAGAVDAAREALGLRQMHLAAGVLRLDRSPEAWKAFAFSPDPTVRSLLVENAAALGIDPGLILARLNDESDLGVRRALLVALGNYDKTQFDATELADFAPTLEKYRADDDAGVHGAAEWLTREWTAKKVVDATAGAKPRSEQTALAAAGAGPSWYTTGQGHEMATIRGPVDFRMGSPANDPNREGGPTDGFERQHTARIGRSYAIGMKEVTLAQFLAAWNDLKGAKEFFGPDGKPIDEFPYDEKYAADPRCPVNNVDWFHAAAYCNWLSKQEGIPESEWVYDDKEIGFADKMVLPANYLKRTGYRLPTEAEWEYACRSGATSSRFFGEGAGLLGKYGWYERNSENKAWPVGTLKPNEFGLFDVYGNVSEWCLDEPRVYAEGTYDDVEAKNMGRLVDAEKLRVHRGGAFQYIPKMATSASRDRSDPDYAYFSIGFRVARTLPGAVAAAKPADGK